ncbi:hypothetical protein GCM10011320_50250 [Neoroseomonas lacus]|uniref:Uncharacterized protein n=1 Tax=Neoroseomonas lacus TaxID=287609 RepID=A0A917NY73_9PROT|nr:hypothetical protein GCM10011320_50250 [Neoroseomonas lacus]
MGIKTHAIGTQAWKRAFHTRNSGSRPRRDPGAHGATAPRLPAAARAPVHGAKAKRAEARAGV